MLQGGDPRALQERLEEELMPGDSQKGCAEKGALELRLGR